MGNPTLRKTATFGIVIVSQERRYTMFHKLKLVKSLDDYRLSAEFEDGTRKLYDVKILFDKCEDFQILLHTPAIFKQVTVDVGGYGIVWNDELDLSSEELWEHGINY